jgi:thiopeptide-type bacteriocin biosynthesis protein
MPADQLTTPAVTPPAGPDAGGWRQYYVEFADWAASEQVFAAHLAPLLRRAADDELVRSWWFIRKYPCWRLRLAPGPGGQQAEPWFAAALDKLASGGVITRWLPGVYEPEEAAFGGPEAMAVAHDLFAADSAGVTSLLTGTATGLGRRELSVLLCGLLMRGAGMEWYEQGDAWARVARDRPLPASVPAGKLTAMSGSLTTVLTADVTGEVGLAGPAGPAAEAAWWAAAFTQAGQALGEQARAGTLRRGLREVIAYHVIFHWNRLGLTARQQAVLAWSARTAILGQPQAAPSPVSRVTRPPGSAARVQDFARWFPLVPRPRPACPDLETRVDQVRAAAADCGSPSDPLQRIDLACTAWNQAALTAADCGLPQLAASLCRRQYAIFAAGPAVSGLAAVAALQPLVNLARLDIREGQPRRAWHGLEQIRRAARDGGTAEVGGTSFSLDGIAGADAPPVATWLRGVLLQDATRALAAAGDWAAAAGHAAFLDDQPGRMREARQSRVIDRILCGDAAFALSLIDSGTYREPWEHVVTACLRALASITAGTVHTGTVAALAAARGACQPDGAGTALFRARLGLTAASIAVALDAAMEDHATLVIGELADDACQSEDALAAREILRHLGARDRLTPDRASSLDEMVRRAGLARGTIPQPLLASLEESASTAGIVLAAALTCLA